MSVEGLFEWLVDGAPGARSSEAVVTRIGEGLDRGGVDVERIGAVVSALHPDVFGRGFMWIKGEQAQVREIGHAFLQGEVFQASPVAKVYRERLEIAVASAIRPSHVTPRSLASSKPKASTPTRRCRCCSRLAPGTPSRSRPSALHDDFVEPQGTDRRGPMTAVAIEGRRCGNYDALQRRANPAGTSFKDHWRAVRRRFPGQASFATSRLSTGQGALELQWR